MDGLRSIELLIKYSFILPYHNRYSQTRIALESFRNFYENRNDYEVLFIEDQKNYIDIFKHNEYLNLLTEFSDLPLSSFIGDDYHNPALKFNYGVDRSLGKFIILSNPEIVHKVDILSGLDEEFNKDSTVYVMCSCESVLVNTLENNKLVLDHDMWYQHSIHNNRCLHFCSALSKNTYNRIGGFDEEYTNGIAYDDDDFRETIKANKIEVVYRDDLHTYHLAHERSYQINQELWKINRIYFNKKWGKE